VKLSPFTPLGLLRLSAATPTAERFYRSIIAGYGGQFSTDEGSLIDADAFARARAMARCARDVRRAALQGVPSQSGAVLPLKETEKGIIPDPTATMQERRAELAARSLVSAGSTVSNMETALAALLGADFLALHTVAVADTVIVSQADGGDVNFQRPDVARKIITVDEPMSLPGGGAQWFPYTVLSSSQGAFSGQPEALITGDMVCLQPHMLGRAEVVEVLDVDEIPDGSGNNIPHFECEYTLSHDDGSIGFTHPLPMDARTKRHSLVVVDAAVALDPETRRQINELMRRMVRDCSTWDIVADDGAGNTAQFTIGVDSIGISHATPVTY